MSNAVLRALVCAAVLAQLGVLLWTLIGRRGVRPVLVVNLLFAGAALILAGSQLPLEFALARQGALTEALDFKATIWCSFELVVLAASLLAFRGALAARIIAWIGFAANFLLSLLAALFVLAFEFKCCGYL